MFGRVVVAKEVVIHHISGDFPVVSIKELACVASEGRVINECSNTIHLVSVGFTRVLIFDLFPHVCQLCSRHEGCKEFIKVGRSWILLDRIWYEFTVVTHFVGYV